MTLAGKTNLACAAALAALALAALPASAAGSSSPAVAASWSQIMGSTVSPAAGGAPTPLNIHMRFLLTGAGSAPCEGYYVKPDGGKPIRVAWSVRTNPVQFPGAAVCDAAMDPAWTSATLSDAAGTPIVFTQGDLHVVGRPVSFPGARPVGRRAALKVAVFGDSGCRQDSEQTCAAGAAVAWAFADLVRAAMGDDPDLVIHVGDYRYRDQRERTLDNWTADFFTPAQFGFLQVPWALARGNHESCEGDYAGRGWYLFFGPAGLDRCPGRPGAKAHQKPLDPPWYFDVAGSGVPPHRFIVIDTAPELWLSGVRDGMRDNYETAMQWAQRGWSNAPASAWLVQHKPIWGLDTRSPPGQNDTEVAGAFELAIRGLTAAELGGCVPYGPACGLKAVVAGHQHMLQTIVFPVPPGPASTPAWMLPQQFVVGNSGVALRQYTDAREQQYPFRPAGLRDCASGFVTGTVVDWRARRDRRHRDDQDFGYVVFTRTADPAQQSGWSGEAKFYPDPRFRAQPPIALGGRYGSVGMKAACN